MSVLSGHPSLLETEHIFGFWSILLFRSYKSRIIPQLVLMDWDVHTGVPKIREDQHLPSNKVLARHPGWRSDLRSFSVCGHGDARDAVSSSDMEWYVVSGQGFQILSFSGPFS